MPIPVYWHCPNGHILGEVRLVNHHHRLFVFRYSFLASSPPSFSPENGGGPALEGQVGADIASVAQGTTIFYCSICGAARTWAYAREKPSAKLLDKRQEG